jgi:nucleotide-binding universal stress UspA family protein
MYKRILLAVDDGDASKRALKEAVRVKIATGAVLKVLHVVHESLEDASYAPSTYRSKVTTPQHDAGEAMLARASDTLRHEGIEHERQLSEIVGITVAQEIVRQADAWTADLIVMGTNGRRGLSRLLMGSNAESVLRTSRVPVLLVRDQADGSALPSTSPAASYGRALVPVDGSDLSLKELERALDYARAAGAQVRVVYVPVNLQKEGAAVIASVQAAVATHGLTIDTEVVETKEGSAARAILDAAKRWNADLIAMGTHGRRGMRRVTMGSDAEDILRTSTVPVLLTCQEEEIRA